MIFQFHIAYALELLVMAVGLGFLTYSRRAPGDRLLKFGGFILIALTAFSLFCTIYYGVRYWEDGHFRNPHGDMKSCCRMNMRDRMKNFGEDGAAHEDMMEMMRRMHSGEMRTPGAEEQHPDHHDEGR